MSVTSDEAGAPVRRLGKLIKLRPEHREEYLRLHAEVWPEVRAMLTACGLRNFSILLRGELLFRTPSTGERIAPPTWPTWPPIP